MKNTNQIHELIDNTLFSEWANSSFDISHPFTTSSLYTSLDQDTIQSAKLLYSSLSFAKKNLDLSTRSSILKNIHASIDSVETIETVNIDKTLKSRSISMKWMGIAASFVALFGVLFLLNSNEIINVKTNYGEVVTVDLPDGSFVELDANSSLVMLDDWSGRGDRNLKLENSAYFDVTNDPKVGGASFNVFTKAAKIEVIGTGFSVDAEENSTTITVKSGKVKVSPTESSDFQTQILTAGDQLVIRDGLKVMTDELTATQVENELAWIDGKIYLDNTSFQELESIVKDRYNKTLIVDEALRSSTRGVNGTYPIMSVEDLLNPVAVALDLQISYIGDTILLGYSKKN